MSFLIWNPELEQLEFSLQKSWAGEVTILMTGTHALRAEVNVITPTRTKTTMWMSCANDTGGTVPPPEGGLVVVAKGTESTPPYYPKVTIKPTYAAGARCTTGVVPTTTFVVPTDQTMIGDGPKVKHEVCRFVSPDGDTVEVVVVIKNESGGGARKSLHDYTVALTNHVRATRPRMPKTEGAKKSTTARKKKPANGNGRTRATK